MKTVFKARRLLTPLESVENAVVAVEDGTIVSIASRAEGPIPEDARVVDFGDGVLAPAFFDQHVHGGAGFDLMEGSDAALLGVGAFLAKHGVAGYLATTVTAPMDATLRALEALAKFIGRTETAKVDQEGQAAPAGIHLEGPFLSHAKRGVHSPELLLTPTVELFERLWQAAEGRVLLMTIAPELPNAGEVITHATRRGVRVSVGHSDATAAETRAGLAAGATCSTHTFNAMRALNQREPGILGAVLDESGLFAEIICDGYHVDPSVVRLFWKAKGAERAILITDGISATGMPDGHYKLGGLEVEVVEGKCMAFDGNGAGAIAGSTLTMDRALENFCAFTSAGLGEAVGLAGRNSAQLLGLGDRFGSLRVGGPADFCVLSERGALRQVVLRGRAD